MSSTADAALSALAERLRERRSEIERATLARVHAISDPRQVEDPAYAAGLREAVGAGLDYGLVAIDAPVLPGQVPLALLAQARYAARSQVGLDTVLRRYFAGYAVLGDFIVAAAEQTGLPASELQRLLRTEVSLCDHLLATVTDEYNRERAPRPRTDSERKAQQVRMLLNAELLEPTELDYELDAWHLGAIATGPGARATLRDLAKALDRRLLCIGAEEETLWAWLGGKSRLSSREVLSLAEGSWPTRGALILGEPGEGIEGWRLTHRQAKAAAPIAARTPRCLVAYADVALFAAAHSDEVLEKSLRETYLMPLEAERDGGEVLRETLRAYFDAGRNASAAAAALGIRRQTVSVRLRTVEQRIGRSPEACAAELETALTLREL